MSSPSTTCRAPLDATDRAAIEGDEVNASLPSPAGATLSSRRHCRREHDHERIPTATSWLRRGGSLSATWWRLQKRLDDAAPHRGLAPGATSRRPSHVEAAASRVREACGDASRPAPERLHHRKAPGRSSGPGGRCGCRRGTSPDHARHRPSAHLTFAVDPAPQRARGAAREPVHADAGGADPRGDVLGSTPRHRRCCDVHPRVRDLARLVRASL